MSAERSFALTALRMGAGLLVWAAHFAAVYVYVALVCAHGNPGSEVLGFSTVRVVVMLMTLLALGAQWHILHQALRGRWRKEAQQDGQPFIAWIAAAAAAAGAVAALWSVLPTLWITLCVPP